MPRRCASPGAAAAPALTPQAASLAPACQPELLVQGVLPAHCLCAPPRAVPPLTRRSGVSGSTGAPPSPPLPLQPLTRSTVTSDEVDRRIADLVADMLHAFHYRIFDQASQARYSIWELLESVRAIRDVSARRQRRVRR